MAITLLEMMLQAELITGAQCDEALQNRVFFGGKIGTNLIELRFVEEEDLARFLSRKLGVPYVPPKRLLNLADGVLDLIPRDLALKYQVIPLGLENRRLHLAMADPADLRAIDDIAFITGHVIKPMITPEIRLNQALAQYYQVKMDDRFWQIIDRMGPPRDLPEAGEEAPAVSDSGQAEPTFAVEPEGPVAAEWKEYPFQPKEPVEKSSWASTSDQPAVDSGTVSEPKVETAGTQPENEPTEPDPTVVIPESWEVPLAAGELTEPEKLDVEPGTGGRDWPHLDERVLEPPKDDRSPSGAVEAKGSLDPSDETEKSPEEFSEVPEDQTALPATPESEEVEDLDEADIVEEEPPKVLIEPVTRDPVSHALAQAADREEIADILVGHLGKAFGKVALFVVRQTYASGWHAVRDGVHIPDFANLRIPLTRPSVLKSVTQGQSYFLGALPETPLNDRILGALGGNGRQQILVLPLFIAGRVVILAYLAGGQVNPESRVAELQRLMKKTALAFEILIARDKILMA